MSLFQISKCLIKYFKIFIFAMEFIKHLEFYLIQPKYIKLKITLVVQNMERYEIILKWNRSFNMKIKINFFKFLQILFYSVWIYCTAFWVWHVFLNISQVISLDKYSQFWYIFYIHFPITFMSLANYVRIFTIRPNLLEMFWL